MAKKAVLTGVLCILLLAEHTCCLHASSVTAPVPKTGALTSSYLLQSRLLVASSTEQDPAAGYEVVAYDSEDADEDEGSVSNNQGDENEDENEDHADECDLQQADEHL